MRVVLHLRFSLAPERREELLDFLALARPVYEAPGGIRVRLLEGAGALDEMVEVIEYDSAAAYEADQLRIEADPAMRDLLARWRTIIDGPPAVEVYTEILPPAGG